MSLLLVLNRLGCFGGGGGAAVTFDFYVDSAAAGGGDGSSVATPFNTLAAASAALVNGSSLGLVDGSYFQEEIDEAALTNVRIGSVPNWLTLSSGGWSAGAEPLVYKRTISGAVGLGIILKEGSSELSFVSSEKMCSQDAGSYWVTYSGTDVVLYIHPTGSGNPASNGLAYTHRILPFIDCTEVLTGFLPGLELNVYKVSGLTPEAGALAYNTVSEDGILLQRKTSEALSSADPGSCFITADTGSTDFYVHASDSGIPITNGKEYRYSARLYAIHLGDGANVSGIETSGQRHNDGSTVLGANSTLTTCAIRNGHKHNALCGFGSAVRSNRFLEGHYHVDTGIQLVIYSGGAIAGLPHTYVEDNVFVNRGLLAAPTQGVYCHTSGANGGTDIYYRRNRWLDCFGAIYANASNIAGAPHFDDNYITISPGFTASLPYSFGSPYIQAVNLDGNKAWFPEPYATTFTVADKFIEAGATIVFDDNIMEIGPYFTSMLAATGGTPDVTARNNKGSHFGEFIRLGAASNTITDCSGNVMGASRPISTINTTVISACNNNHWPSAQEFRRAGSIKTWAQWVADGFDVASDGAGDNREATLRPGQTAYGDARDYPHCWFWHDAQVASSITESGGDVSAVADLSGKGRNLVLHEPVPGTDKVSYSQQGGLPYFAPVANGGLVLPVQDFNMPLHMIAAVVRLSAPLSAAASQQFLLSTHPGDDSSIRLGSFSGVFTDEIVAALASNIAGYAYTSASDSYAASTPHLLLLYRDPVDGLVKIEIDGVAIATMPAVGSVNLFALGGNKSFAMMLMRGNASVNKLGGHLGFMAGFGPVSLDAKALLTTYLKTRWGIV